ncbi:Replication protein A DNA-binding subunit A [Nymphaea thermarum]|nr:Replication protein A DNA-binding subunit A [Nymphaea thermarum]
MSVNLTRDAIAMVREPSYVNRGPIAKNEAPARIIPIAALNPCQGRWAVKERVTSKGCSSSKNPTMVGTEDAHETSGCPNSSREDLWSKVIQSAHDMSRCPNSPGEDFWSKVIQSVDDMLAPNDDLLSCARKGSKTSRAAIPEGFVEEKSPLLLRHFDFPNDENDFDRMLLPYESAGIPNSLILRANNALMTKSLHPGSSSENSQVECLQMDGVLQNKNPVYCAPTRYSDPLNGVLFSILPDGVQTTTKKKKKKKKF